ncbi:MAG TPA: hypothetical protein VNO51_09460 [Ilumatobacteraceae bacterium]|nr:hypothetical protein [Ilumatobacteraceae bacterium]
MDFSKFKTSDWLKVGGGLGVLIFAFVSWIKVSGFGASDSGGNAFDFFWTGTLPWILIVGTAVVTVLLVSGTLKPGNLPWPLITFIATALGALLLLIRLIFNPLEGKDLIESAGGEVGRGVGMILSTISGVVAAVGGFLGFKESGGELSDLKDFNKLKGSFDKPGDATPPPPPPPPAV